MSDATAARAGGLGCSLPDQPWPRGRGLVEGLGFRVWQWMDSEPPARVTLNGLLHLSTSVCTMQMLQLILQAVVRSGTGELGRYR